MPEQLCDPVLVAKNSGANREYWTFQPVFAFGEIQLQLLSYDETARGDWPHHDWLPHRNYSKNKRSPLSFNEVPLPVEVVKLAKETFAARLIKLTEVTK